jgi:hypothetical protein
MILGYVAKEELSVLVCVCILHIVSCFIYHSSYKDTLCLQIDYISRLMWQAQLRGHKTWRLVPPPDCDHICTGFSFRVEPGDIGKLLLNGEMIFHIS